MNRFRKEVSCLAALLALPTLSMAQGTGCIFGRVVAADGSPVAGARVRVALKQNEPGRWALCDLNGLFRIERLEPGTYQLFWSAPHHYERIPFEGPFPATTLRRPRVVVDAGRESGPLSLPMARTTVFCGRIWASDGQPVRWGTIRLQFGAPEGFRYVVPVNTDASGEYEYESGRYGPSSFEVMEPEYGFTPAVWFALNGGRSTRADVRLRKTAAVDGRVINSDGLPAAGVVVSWWIEDPGAIPPGGTYELTTLGLIGGGQQTTDQYGVFIVPHMPSGRCHLRVYYGPRSVEGNPSVEQVVELRDGEKRHSIVLRFPAGQ